MRSRRTFTIAALTLALGASLTACTGETDLPDPGPGPSLTQEPGTESPQPVDPEVADPSVTEHVTDTLRIVLPNELTPADDAPAEAELGLQYEDGSTRAAFIVTTVSPSQAGHDGTQEGLEYVAESSAAAASGFAEGVTVEAAEVPGAVRAAKATIPTASVNDVEVTGWVIAAERADGTVTIVFGVATTDFPGLEGLLAAPSSLRLLG